MGHREEFYQIDFAKCLPVHTPGSHYLYLWWALHSPEQVVYLSTFSKQLGGKSKVLPESLGPWLFSSWNTLHAKETFWCGMFCSPIGNLHILLVGMQLDAATTENRESSKKKKIRLELPYHPAIPLLGISPRNTKTLIWRDRHPYIHHNIIYNSQDREITQVPIDRWMGKEDGVYMYNGVLFSH